MPLIDYLPCAVQLLHLNSDDYDKANNQVLKFKEKNRAAQRRYRERQKVRAFCMIPVQIPASQFLHPCSRL